MAELNPGGFAQRSPRHARDVRGAAGGRRHTGRLRAQPPCPAGGRIPGRQTDAVLAHDASGYWATLTFPRRSRPGRAISSAPRASPTRSQRHRRERAGGLRPPVARRAARGSRDLQPRDARLPAAPALVTPTTGTPASNLKIGPVAWLREPAGREARDSKRVHGTSAER